MKISYHKRYSSRLQRDMEYKTYGHQGKPVLVFPTSCARFYQYEDNGMIHALAPYIEDGRLQIWTCDSVDEETFYAEHADVERRIARHNQYDAYLAEELVPIIREVGKLSNGGVEQKLMVTGCSMGAFHSANFFFRHPQFFDTLIALSGLYSTNRFFGNDRSKGIYFHSPIDYVRNLEDETYLQQYRNSRIIVCTGQGAHEDLMREETGRLEEVLRRKGIPAWIDYWGFDVNHDWDWWRKQIRYFMANCLGGQP